MNNFSQEYKKYQEYSELNPLDISMFIYRLFFVIVISSLFYKFVVAKIFTELAQSNKDLFIFNMFVFLVLFIIYEQRKIYKIEQKKKSYVFETVNVYQFLTDYLNNEASEEWTTEHLDMFYQIVCSKHLENKLHLKENQEELKHLQTLQESIQNRTICLPSLSIMNYLSSI